MARVLVGLAGASLLLLAALPVLGKGNPTHDVRLSEATRIGGLWLMAGVVELFDEQRPLRERRLAKGVLAQPALLRGFEVPAGATVSLNWDGSEPKTVEVQAAAGMCACGFAVKSLSLYHDEVSFELLGSETIAGFALHGEVALKAGPQASSCGCQVRRLLRGTLTRASAIPGITDSHFPAGTRFHVVDLPFNGDGNCTYLEFHGEARMGELFVRGPDASYYLDGRRRHLTLSRPARIDGVERPAGAKVSFRADGSVHD